MISTSEIKVSVLIDKADSEKAMRAIHDKFLIDFYTGRSETDPYNSIPLHPRETGGAISDFGRNSYAHELTPQDIEKMQKELDYRRIELMPELLEEVKRTRAFGDLSENYEYKAAKQAQNANRKRIRYLTRMIQSSTLYVYLLTTRWVFSTKWSSTSPRTTKPRPSRW